MAPRRGLLRTVTKGDFKTMQRGSRARRFSDHENLTQSHPGQRTGQILPGCSARHTHCRFRLLGCCRGQAGGFFRCAVDRIGDQISKAMNAQSVGVGRKLADFPHKRSGYMRLA